MRTMLRGKVTLLFMMLGMLLAVPTVALAADIVSDVNADLSSDVLAPTEVNPNDSTNAFDIKVWATGTFNNISTRDGFVTVTKNYETFLDSSVTPAVWKIRGGSLATDKVDLSFKNALTAADIGTDNSFNYTPGQDCPLVSAATMGTGAKGCQTNPLIVEGNLSVGNVPLNTTLKLTDAMAGTSNLTVTTDPTSSKYSLDSGFVKVVSANTNPFVSLPAANANGTEGDTLQTNGAFTDNDAGDSLTLSVPSGTPGTFTGNSDGTWSWSLETNDDVTGGPITVTATDESGATATDDFTYSAANDDPNVTIDAITKPDGTELGSVACLAGNAVSLDFSFTDAGSADTHDASIDWGDNSTDTAIDPAVSPKENVEHTYNSPGSYTITVTVTDDDHSATVDGQGSANNGASPLSFRYNMSGILSPFNPDGSSTFKYGSTVPVKVKITDCAGTSVSGLSPKLGVRLSSPTTPVLGINEDVFSTSNADTGNTLRYDASAGQYIYNYNTKSNLTPDSTASYYMVVEEASSTPNPVSQKFGLKLK